MRKIDYSVEIDKIAEFMRSYLVASGFDGYIIGISGGIDSALSAALAVQAIGKEKVLGILLPYKNSHPDSEADGRMLCESLDIEHLRVDISPIVDAYFTNEPEADNLRKGNWMARTRMCVIFDLSAKYRYLVVGTSNQSEWMTGYFTQYGDSACAIEPIGQLYKTEVWEMAAELRIPAKIIQKAPTADLWKDQTDESEMGISYRDLDCILYAIARNEDLSSFPKEKLNTVYRLMARSAYKRLNPPFPEAPCCL